MKKIPKSKKIKNFAITVNAFKKIPFKTSNNFVVLHEKKTVTTTKKFNHKKT